MAEFTPTEEEIDIALEAATKKSFVGALTPAEIGYVEAALTAVYPLLVQRICNEIDGRVGKFQHIKNSRVYGEYGSGWRDGTSNARSLVRDYAKGATKNE